MKKVVFACVHNAGRSQMAAALFNQLADPRLATAVSAGTQPAARVHPEVVNAMREVGVDLADVKPRPLTDGVAAGAAWLITMGCGEECPVVPGARREDWPLPDPAGRPLDEARAVRDEIRARVEAFLAREGLALPAIVEGGADKVGEVLAFLAKNGLPAAGLGDHAVDLLLAREEGRLLATAALEVYGEEALLRSVAVDAGARGTGLGGRITRAALDLARRRGVRRVYLLTETAAGFFPRLGFVPIERASTPESIQGSVEFAKACPAGAAVMMLTLAERPSASASSAGGPPARRALRRERARRGAAGDRGRARRG